MLAIVPTRRFLRDARLAKKRGCKLEKLEAIITALAGGEQLAPSLRDHALSGDWHEFRDCHIEPDWLLIYKLEAGQLLLARTGTHSDLFSK